MISSAAPPSTAVRTLPTCASSTPASTAPIPSSPPSSTRPTYTPSNPHGAHADDAGHGTEMAGLAIAGNLTDVLDSADDIEIEHRLESVKLLQNDGANGTDSRHHGYLTAEAVSRPEVSAPARRRVFGMAVTARDNRDRGRPTGWSATVDALAADSDFQGANPRLLVVSAGNVDDNADWERYPDSNESDGLHDPAQAWNALTVGAHTNLTRITEPDTEDYEPIAPNGGLSPFSTTALAWQSQWPLKPDIVLEGGNAAADLFGAVTMASLSLLTTYHEFADRLFTTTNATSAATALASRMAAQVMATYPDLWPETVRALIVHSAEWTDAMKRAHLPHNPAKQDYRRLVQRCGYGVPDLARALWTVANSLTMVVQGTLQPFQKERSKLPTTCDMQLHLLPWPQDALESLGGTEVEMRVTMSYFIEPNPSQRGNSRYRYQSHGLRFDVKRPTETPNAFRARINAAVEREGPEDRRQRPVLAPRRHQPAPRLVALGHLARHRRRTREPRADRRLSHHRLVAHARPTRLRQPERALRPRGQHPGSGHRRGPVHRGSQPDRGVDRSMKRSLRPYPAGRPGDRHRGRRGGTHGH